MCEACIGIARVDQRVQELEPIPQTHLAPVQAQVVRALGFHEIDRLVAVVEPVELLDLGLGFRAVIAKLLLGFGTCARARGACATGFASAR